MSKLRKKLERFVQDGRKDRYATAYTDWEAGYTAGKEQVLDDLAELLERPAPCPYTFAHTRNWCGNPNCRES